MIPRPDFLRQNDNINWPDQPGTLKIEEISPKEVIFNVANTKASKETWIQRFSNVKNWRSLLRYIAWLSRFCVWIRRDRGGLTTSRNLGPDELQAAEVKVLSLVQEERFGEELKLLEGRNMSTRLQLTGSNIKCLSPFKSGGLLRVGGRLNMHPCLSIPNIQSSYRMTTSSHDSSSSIITRQTATLERSIPCLPYGNVSGLYEDTPQLRRSFVSVSTAGVGIRNR